MIAVIGLAWLAWVERNRPYHGADQTEAVNNARQIGLALFEFENDYGTYPDSNTAVAVAAKTGSGLSLGTTSSNDFFRQLIVAYMPSSERMFYARIKGANHPDNVITGSDALKKGECGFTYLMPPPFEIHNFQRPLVVTPMIPGTDRFDPKPFGGDAILLRADNSAISVPIDKSGHVMIDGKNLMSTSHPIWEGHPPVIAWPDL